MTKTIYTEDQIALLSKNPYVAKCSRRYITFTSECRKESVRLYDEERWSPRQIFEALAFPEFIVQSLLPKESLGRWRRTMRKEGSVGLEDKKKGRKKQEREIENRTPEEQVEYLRAKVAYLERENDFLRLLRARKN